jgi:ATP-dependent helicase/DNAse subunit B
MTNAGKVHGDSVDPKLKLLIGPYRSGKTSSAVKEALDYCLENPLVDSVIITPSARYRALMEENVYRRSRGNPAAEHGIMGLRFETFYRFVKVHSAAAGTPDVILSNRLRNGLLAHVLRTLNRQKRLPYLGKIAEMRGTASAILSLIDEFQRAALTPDEVIAALNSQSGADLRDADSRHMEIAEIYRNYHQELLNRGCLDQKLQAMQLCRALNQDTATGPHYGVIVFDGFDRYSRLHAQLAKGLAARCQKVLILFDYAPESENYLWKESSYETLLRELSVKPHIVTEHKHAAPAFDAFTSLDRFTEMQEIARQTKILINTGQAKPSDVLVTARRIRPYQGAASGAFEDFGIPYFLDRSYPADTFPVTHFVLALLGLHVNDFLRQDVMAVLSSRYFSASKHGFGTADIEAIDCESLIAFVLKGKRDWDRYLEGSKFKTTIGYLFEQLTPPSEPKTLSEHCRWCEDKLDLFADFSSANVADYSTSSCLVALRNAFAALIEEERVLSCGPIDYPAFYQSLKETLEASDFRNKPPSNDCVTVCDAELVPNRTYKFVFIAGMLEGEFPAKDGHFNFAGRERLEAWRRRGVLVDNPRTHPGYEDALLKAIVGSASNKVFMSCPRYDTKSKDKEELLPSFALRQFFEDSNLRYVPVYEEALKSPCSIKDLTSAILWSQPDTNLDTLEADLPEYSKYLNSLQGCVTPSKTRLAATRESCFNGYLVDLVESGALPIRFPQYLSATSLDHYGQCPFQFWSTDILRLAPRQEVDPDNQHKLIGNFYHHVMEEFYNGVIERGMTVSEDNKAQLRILFDAAISDGFVWLENNPEFHADEFWTYRKKFLRFSLDKFFDHELSLFSSYAAGFQPAMCEAAFGKGGDYPALELDAGNGRTISIRGKIDRIDLNKEKTLARVVDYKRSAYGLSIKAVLSAQSLQLPVYCLAVTDAIVPGCKIDRAEYAIVGKAESKAVNGGSSVDSAMRNARQRIQEYEADIHRGNFIVQPEHGSYCRSCQQRKVCRIGELPIVESNNYAN